VRLTTFGFVVVVVGMGEQMNDKVFNEYRGKTEMPTSLERMACLEEFMQLAIQ
jgi:hypothetical protein